MQAIFFATGNNMTYESDTARRVVPIALDPQMERPEERTGFQHSPLLPWVTEQRPQLVAAALTILRAYFAAGCPSQGITPMGSFDEWSTLVRQALIWTGEADLLEGQTQLGRESNPTVEAERSLLTCWATCYPKSEAVTLQRVKQDIELYAALPPKPPNEWNNLRDALGEFDPRYDGNTFNPKIVGYALRSMQGRVRDGKRLVRGGTTHGTTEWQVTAL